MSDDNQATGPSTIPQLQSGPGRVDAATAVSPTGQPMIPPAAVKPIMWATGALMAIAMANGGIAAAIPQAQHVCTIIAAIAGSLGSAGLYLLGLSPGLRKTPPS